MKTTTKNEIVLEVRPLNSNTTKMAVLKPTTIHSIKTKAIELGYIIKQSGKVILGVIDYDGEKVFTAIKYSNGCHCHIDINFAKQVGLTK